jgi:CRP/FNR family transcriptional regulator, cyclic AMP receptor protein
MNYEAINQYLNHCGSFNEAEMRFFNSRLSFKEYPAHHQLLRNGEVCAFEAFVVAGCVKTYYIDSQGSEVVLTFATENWWIGDVLSFEEQTPSKMFIETLEPTQLFSISPEAKRQILTQIPTMERVFRLMIQRHLASLQERLFGLIALTAQERYDIFLEKHPRLTQRIPQYLIASYLGITPEFLSRLRKRKAQG